MKTAHGRAVAGAGQEAVERRIADLKSRLPVGLELGTIYFQPDIVVRAIDGFIVTLAEAVVIALSMMVDNAVVISEGMLIGVQQGGDAEQVAGEAVARTMWPLLGGTAIAILAFAAIGLSQDATGEYCFSLFLVILFAIGLSWVLAVTVPPVLGVMILKAKPGAADKVRTPTCSTAATGACSWGACASAGPPSP